MRYENPVLPGLHPDPSICRVGETFYLATSSFEYFPGIPLYRSTNLVDWEPIGHALTRESQILLEGADSSGGIFAPTLRHHDGTFYLASTNVSADGNFVVTASDPAGEWSDPVWVDAPGIDPDLFWDGVEPGSDGDSDDTCYFTYFSDDPERGIEQAEFDPDTGELGPARTIWSGSEDPFAEAPHIYERDGWYYLVVAEGGTHTGHMVVVARADDPTGPYEPYPDNPILTQRSDARSEIKGTGHADLVTDDAGNWWLVCLGFRQVGAFPSCHHLGRETCLVPVTWEDGWPVVADCDVSTPAMDAPLPGERQDSTTSIHYTDTEFADGFGAEWNFRRNPERDRYDTDTDGLVLWGGPERLDEPGATFVGRRQTAFDCQARARFTFDPDSHEEAGLAVFLDEAHHYQVGITRDKGERTALARLRIGDATQVVGSTPVGETTTLQVRAGEESTADYQFLADGDELGTASARYVSSEVASGFTGVYLGLYATGRGEAASTPAHVDRFVYESLGSA